jgi:uncharacterized low-complexity protein
MSKQFSKKPIALALGAAFALTGAVAQASVFQVTDLAAGYMVASAGDDKKGEHKCGEAKCGAACMKDKMDKGGMKEVDAKAACDKMKAEGKCGEGKCGADKKKTEGKCGEGKCGGKK